MELNVATTISFCAAAISSSFVVLGAYLARSPASRHFLYASAAGLAATVYPITDAALAAGFSPIVSAWAGRVGFVASIIHGAGWVAFLAAWDRRALSRIERALMIACAVASVVSLVPGLAVLDGVTDRPSSLLRVTYHDPLPGPLCFPVLAVVLAGEMIATASAIRMSRTNPKALIVGVALGFILFTSIIDSLTALHLIDLPFLVDPALAFGLMSIGSVIVSDAADSATKSAELDRARVALAEKENLAAVGQLAAVVAHEVRNPVAIILGALSVLQRRAPVDDEEAKLRAMLGEEAERLKQLVARLLDAVRPFELQYARLHASELVQSAISQVVESAGVEATQVSLVGAPSDEIECDGVLLGQAISNLVQNALIATGRKSPVQVTATVEDSRPAMLRVDVTDDGDGVPIEVRPRLFTPFFTTRETGTGLGLALVKRIAGAHGGSVEFEPRAERGASFVLRVPLRAGDSAPRRLIGGDVQ